MRGDPTQPGPGSYQQYSDLAYYGSSLEKQNMLELKKSLKKFEEKQQKLKNIQNDL